MAFSRVQAGQAQSVAFAALDPAAPSELPLAWRASSSGSKGLISMLSPDTVSAASDSKAVKRRIYELVS